MERRTQIDIERQQFVTFLNSKQCRVALRKYLKKNKLLTHILYGDESFTNLTFNTPLVFEKVIISLKRNQKK
jgi:hypothetical protein